MAAKYTEAAVQVSRQVSLFKLKERDWKIRSTKVDYSSECVKIKQQWVRKEKKPTWCHLFYYLIFIHYSTYATIKMMHGPINIRFSNGYVYLHILSPQTAVQYI